MTSDIPTPTAAGLPDHLSKQDVMARLCRLMWHVRERRFPDEACDCFCGQGPIGHLSDQDYRNDGAALAWIEAAVERSLS